MVYANVINHLGFTVAHFDVRKGNERVGLFHESFGAKRVMKSDVDYFYTIDYKVIDFSHKFYGRFLKGNVEVEFK